MSGLILLGVPLVIGAFVAPVLLSILGANSVIYTERLLIECVIIAIGALGRYLWPPEGADSGKNWIPAIVFVSVFSIGTWSVIYDLIVIIMQDLVKFIKG